MSPVSLESDMSPVSLVSDMSPVSLESPVSLSLIGMSLSTVSLLSVDRVLALQCDISYFAVVTTPRGIFIMLFIRILHFFVSCIRLLLSTIFTHAV